MKTQRLSLFFIIFLISCKNDVKQDSSYAIMSLMVNRLAKPVVPPPPPNLSDVEFEIKADSIIQASNKSPLANEKFILSIEPIENFDIPQSISFSDIEFKTLVTELEKSNENNIIDISMLSKIRNIEYRKITIRRK